ncbi:unnamed protein product, partial [marine sediment metagenome]
HFPDLAGSILEPNYLAICQTPIAIHYLEFSLMNGMRADE